MVKHAFLPTTLISNKDSTIVSHVNKEVAGVLGFTLKHASTKHAQTVGLLERYHSSIKQALKNETGERRSLWQKYVSIAFLNYNTSYHTSIGCEPAEFFMGVFLTMSWIWNWEFVHSKHPLPLCNLLKMFLTKRKWFTIMLAEMLCKLTSNLKPIMTKRPTLQNSSKQISYMFYSRKRIMEGVKFRLGNSRGLAPKLLKRCYLITINWYAKMAPTIRKCFIACESASSHPANPHLTHESRHKNGNPIRRWASNTMICMPERGSVNRKS